MHIYCTSSQIVLPTTNISVRQVWQKVREERAQVEELQRQAVEGALFRKQYSRVRTVSMCNRYSHANH